MLDNITLYFAILIRILVLHITYMWMCVLLHFTLPGISLFHWFWPCSINCKQRTYIISLTISWITNSKYVEGQCCLDVQTVTQSTSSLPLTHINYPQIRMPLSHCNCTMHRFVNINTVNYVYIVITSVTRCFTTLMLMTFY